MAQKLTEIKDGKGNVTAAIHHDTLTSRHPKAVGKTIRIGVAKLSQAEKIQAQADLQKILDAAPLYEHESPPNIPEKIRKAYFRHIDPAPLVEIIIGDDGVDGKLWATVPNGEKEMLDQVIEKVHKAPLELELAKAKRDNARLEARVSDLLRLLDEKSDAERRTPLSYCLKQFKLNYTPKKADAKPDYKPEVLRRVEVVVNALGLDQPYGSITMPFISRALSEMKTKQGGLISEAEKSKRAADARIFFGWCCRSKEGGGLGFVKNPTLDLRSLTPRQLQKKRQAKGQVVVALEPKEILPKMPDLRWRTFYAVCCYTGGRAAEVAALSWERIEDDKKLISFWPLPDQGYESLKNDISERCLVPFAEIWPYLNAYKATFSEPKGLLFRQNNGKSYFRLKGKKRGRLNHVSKWLSRNLKKAGVEDAKEPNRRTRRYWENRMRSEGKADLIPVFGGHSTEMGLSHYTNSRTVAETVLERFKKAE